MRRPTFKLGHALFMLDQFPMRAGFFYRNFALKK